MLKGYKSEREWEGGAEERHKWKLLLPYFLPFPLFVCFLNSMKCVSFTFCAHLISYDDVHVVDDEDDDDAEKTTFLEVGLKGVDPVH